MLRLLEMVPGELYTMKIFREKNIIADGIINVVDKDKESVYFEYVKEKVSQETMMGKVIIIPYAPGSYRDKYVIEHYGNTNTYPELVL